jgi:hypothetical protein
MGSWQLIGEYKLNTTFCWSTGRLRDRQNIFQIGQSSIVQWVLSRNNGLKTTYVPQALHDLSSFVMVRCVALMRYSQCANGSTISLAFQSVSIWGHLRYPRLFFLIVDGCEILRQLVDGKHPIIVIVPVCPTTWQDDCDASLSGIWVYII